MDFGQLLQEYFTPEVVTAILSALASVFAILKVTVSFHKAAKEKCENAKEIGEKVVSVAKDTTKEAVEKVKTELAPEIAMIKSDIETLSKVLMLMQENSAQSRIAILELIEKNGIDTTEAKVVVEEEIKKEEEIKTEKIEILDKITNEGRY